MAYQEIRERIGQYSESYGELADTAVRLHENGDSRAALTILFTAADLLFRSVRGAADTTPADDLRWLLDNGYLAEGEYAYLCDPQSGIGVLRQEIERRDCLDYSIELGGQTYPFSEAETWQMLFDLVFPQLFVILYKVLCRLPG